MAVEKLEKETQFLKQVMTAAEKDTGIKAAFKRALTGERHHRRKVYPLVLPLLEGIDKHHQDIWIFVASLAVFHNQEGDSKARSFAESCRDLKNSTKSQGSERRFRALLDTDLVNNSISAAN